MLREPQLVGLQLGEEILIALRLARLALQRIDLAAHLAEDVLDAEEVRLGVLELAERLFLLAFEFGDARRLLEDGAAVLRAGREDLVDLPLLHDRVGGPADAGVHEELVDVAQAARVLVDLVLAGAVAEEAAGDGDFVELGAELVLAVAEGQRDLGHAERLAGVAPAENDVLHLAAPERLGRLLAEHPADRIEDVAFAAAVRPDDGGDARMELNDGFVGERLEAEDVKRLEIHGRETYRCSRDRTRKLRHFYTISSG